MSIVVVVKKGKEIVIASDTLTSSGQIKWSSKYKENSKKFFEYEGTYIGSVGMAMSKIMLNHALKNSEEEFTFDGLENLYNSMLKIHQLLKKEYFLVPTSKKVEQTVEETKLNLLIANSSGIYKVSSDRHIAKLTKFWAIGSGGAFALGAMHHAYEKKKYTAMDIAKIGVESACEFDKSCALPMDIKRIKLK
jgi:ATP-dependent protease HslVU (ClpYQ) peptidase subunit